MFCCRRSPLMSCGFTCIVSATTLMIVSTSGLSPRTTRMFFRASWANSTVSAAPVQRVEGVEELLHRLLLVAEELDVVQQQDVALLAVARAELGHAVLLERVDEVVGERLRRQVHNVAIRVLPQRVVADGVHQVRLAESHAAVQEQRVVRLARRVRDR